MNKWFVVLVSTVFVVLSTDANAQALYSLGAPSPEDQLALEVTTVSEGKGAIFVAAVSESSLEPAIIVFAEGEQVAVGRTGTRIVVPPGEYEVRAGTGPEAHRARIEVIVVEGKTVLVEPFFVAIRV